MAVLAALFALLLPQPAAPAYAADGDGPGVELSRQRAEQGGEITVSGSGWRPRALLMILVCGQNMIGGTDACANSEGRAVTAGAGGSFSGKLPVAAPPKPCPCVVHVATVTGERAAENVPFTVAGHPTAPLPDSGGRGRLAVLAATRLEGDDGVLVFFGAPPSRRLVFTVGNLGAATVEDPVFRVGVAHGLYAPRWEERRWHGTLKPGEKALVKLDVELPPGAHGDYEVSVAYGRKPMVSQPWGVGRPWGVTIFWILLAVVVPAAVFRIGMAIVDRVRPPAAARPPGRHRVTRRPSAGPVGPVGPEGDVPGPEGDVPRPEGDVPRPEDSATAPAALPWFTPDPAPAPRRPRPTAEEHL
ncbi:hypothetical protein FFZ77_14450 [Streptomyces katsurahamanus]|uniref:Uncharacterized protein n=1 Tax=Streptomyces katsurahamanus TaxID=2577098 RepID=A0ABW9NTZ1_9ACTN|nr:hypothetical protein [Streptomyces katsurahamanus]MQS36771.1 hypothetical protein [Streptomyces katsurahamanus]